MRAEEATADPSILFVPLVEGKLGAALSAATNEAGTEWTLSERLRLCLASRGLGRALGSASLRRVVLVDQNLSREALALLADWQRRLPKLRSLRLILGEASSAERGSLLERLLGFPQPYPSLRRLSLDLRSEEDSPPLAGQANFPGLVSLRLKDRMTFPDYPRLVGKAETSALRLLVWLMESLPRPELLQNLILSSHKFAADGLDPDAWARRMARFTRLRRFFADVPSALAYRKPQLFWPAPEVAAQLCAAVVNWSLDDCRLPSALSGLHRLELSCWPRSATPVFGSRDGGSAFSPLLRHLRLLWSWHSTGPSVLAYFPALARHFPTLTSLRLELFCDTWERPAGSTGGPFALDEWSEALEGLVSLRLLSLRIHDRDSLPSWELRFPDFRLRLESRLRLSSQPLERLELYVDKTFLSARERSGFVSSTFHLDLSGRTGESLRCVEWNTGPDGTDGGLQSLRRDGVELELRPTLIFSGPYSRAYSIRI